MPYARLRILENGAEVDLLFYTVYDADRFYDFAERFKQADKTGSAQCYLPLPDVRPTKTFHQTGRGTLRVDFLKTMAKDIWAAAHPDDPPRQDPPFKIVVDQAGGGILFTFDSDALVQPAREPLWNFGT